MVRYRRKKALYEVIGKTHLKPRYDKALEQLHPEEADEDRPITEDSDTQAAEAPAWPRKPRIVQFNAGRFEISIPYQLAIALFLGLILLVLVAFRLGQFTHLSSEKSIDSAGQISGGTQREAGRLTAGLQTPATAERTTPPVQPAEEIGSAKPKGDHRIVIKQYNTEKHLKPVQEYFAAHGIETVIEKRGSSFFLLSKNTYENPQRSGTDGYAARQKIIKVGAEYKAPAGYESFAPNLFNDAYGERIK